jgi:hypothetical protein
MDQRESDPTGAFRGGSAGLEDDRKTELERHTPDGTRSDQSDAVDESERDVITSGAAATSEIADPNAQGDAEVDGGGAAQPR